MGKFSINASDLQSNAQQEAGRKLGRARVEIIEEIPHHYYKWFVSCNKLPEEDQRRHHFYTDGENYCRRCDRQHMPRFDNLDDAKVWCADRGFLYIVRAFEGY